jgi:hypothetical protein
MGKIVTCVQHHIGVYTIAKGTTAEVVEENRDTSILCILKPAKGTELHPKELLEVPVGDYRLFWEETT